MPTRLTQPSQPAGCGRLDCPCFPVARPMPKRTAHGCAVHGGDNVAEASVLTIERRIARSQLRPRYGAGWQSM